MKLTFATLSDDQLREIILDQMRYLTDRQVVPTWENFIRYEKLWGSLRQFLDESGRHHYQVVWEQLFRRTFPQAIP